MAGRNKLRFWSLQSWQSELGLWSLRYRGLDLGDHVRLSILLYHVSDVHGLTSFSIDHVEVFGGVLLDPGGVLLDPRLVRVS